jgi:hypothetical protein
MTLAAAKIFGVSTFDALIGTSFKLKAFTSRFILIARKRWRITILPQSYTSRAHFSCSDNPNPPRTGGQGHMTANPGSCRGSVADRLVELRKSRILHHLAVPCLFNGLDVAKLRCEYPPSWFAENAQPGWGYRWA